MHSARIIVWGIKMYTDKIIEEVWKNRASYVNEHHHNMDEIINDLIKRQKHTNRTIVSLYNVPKREHTDEFKKT